MNEKYLIVNAGSSSLKFSLYEMPEEKELVNGYIEKIGSEDCFWTLKINGNKIRHEGFLHDHDDAVEVMKNELLDNKIISSMDEIEGVGHRVVHGGEYYNSSVLVDEEVLKNIDGLTNLCPLHHPGEIAAIRSMQEAMPGVPEVAVFDTAFHQTMPKENYIYAVPYEWYTDYKIRRYGFHGTSHKYITEEMKNILHKDAVNLIICHVGSGASISAIKDGKCFDTSMGLTPLDGLIMGTRCGEIDPSIIKIIMDSSGKNINAISDDLNTKSGLLGICGKNDFRDVVTLMNEDNERARLAYNMFRDAIIKHIAEYYFELEANVDAIVFTAGVLENNVMLREDLINLMSKPLGIKIDKEINNNIGAGHDNSAGIITTKDSKIPVYVLNTSEEKMILRDTYEIVKR